MNIQQYSVVIYLFIYLLVSPYYNTQNYNKNKNNIHDYRQGDRNSMSQLLRARKKFSDPKKIKKNYQKKFKKNYLIQVNVINFPEHQQKIQELIFMLKFVCTKIFNWFRRLGREGSIIVQ